MHLRNLVLALALPLAACGGSAKKTSTAATTVASECATVGQNTARLLAANAPDAPATMTADIGGAIDRHCVADAWTPEARACIGKAATQPALDACDPLLTQAQKDAVGAEIGEIVGKAMGGMMYGGATYGNPCGGGGNPCGM